MAAPKLSSYASALGSCKPLSAPESARSRHASNLPAAAKRSISPRQLTRPGLALLISLLCLQRSSAQTPEPPFALRDGDRVVFYGDSITEQGLYSWWVHLYAATRFPAMRLTFFTAGLGGDKVTGGMGGDAGQRLRRDVFPHRPTVITFMLGMNDGEYKPADEARANRFRSGYQNLLDATRAKLPEARFTLIGPSPMDEVTRGETIPGGYNRVLLTYSGIVRDLAPKYNATFFDQNAPLVAALKDAAGKDLYAAGLLLPDRVHPSPALDWALAANLLEAWNAPAIVTSVALDAHATEPARTTRARVTKIARTGETGISWEELDEALPLPILRSSQDIALIDDAVHLGRRLNQQPLLVAGLEPGQYDLAIDGTHIGTFSADQLAASINLAAYDTPMRRQSQALSWEIRDYESTQFVHTRLLIRQDLTDPGGPESANLRKFEAVLEGRITDAARPIRHLFRVTPAQQPGR